MLTRGFGMVSECSRSLVPRPPQNNTTFIRSLTFRTTTKLGRVFGCERRGTSAHRPRGAPARTSRGASRERRLSGALSAGIALVGPHVSPVAVSPAVVDANILEISVNALQ